MKKVLRKILFGALQPKPFFGVNIPNGEIKESVFLVNGSIRIDISERHNVVCQSPFSIAIWLNSNQLTDFQIEHSHLIVLKHEEILASVSLSLVNSFKENVGTFFVFKIVAIRSHKPGWLKRYLMLKYFFSNAKLLFSEAKAYSAIYSYPRRVIITSFSDKDYYNMFPMDFQGIYPEENMYLLGLKTSNITVNRIIHSGRVVVSSTDQIDSKTVYDLGAHHSKEPPHIEQLPFETRKSDLFKFPVPAFSSNYRELEIVRHHILGSHCMLMARIANTIYISESRSALYHIHIFEFPGSGYAEV
jgi:flavin reductase (DIM6/NTAB) family NADH-FMN oxidoreductase RutF